MRFALSSLALLFLCANAHAKNILKDVHTSFDKTTFVADLTFAKDFNEDNLTVDFINHLLQVNIPNASLASGKFVTNHINKTPIKSLYTYQVDANSMRARIIFDKGQSAKAFQAGVEVIRDGKHLQIRVANVLKAAPAKGEISKTLPVFPPQAVAENESMDDQIQKAALVMSPTAAPAKSAPVTQNQEQAKLKDVLGTTAPKTSVEKEQQVPVLVPAKIQDKSESVAFHKMLTAMGIVALMAATILFALKKWGKNHPKLKDNAKIKVLTQHHLGPKKTLAIVHVAGESMLIGLTDHNISLIKSLSLIDDEIPEQLPSHFSEAIRQVEEPRISISANAKNIAEDNEDFSASGLNEIKGLISSRLKGMRPLQ